MASGATVVIAAGAASVIAAGAASARFTQKYGTLGAWAAEMRGSTETTHYDRVVDAQVGLLPVWLPSGSTDITVKRPGPNAVGVEGVKVDARLGGASLPATCRPADSPPIPWDGGGHWPDAQQDALACAGWLAFVSGDRVFAWR